MPRQPDSLPELQFQPVTRERWEDLQELFGKSGAQGGCWCMWWRLPRSQFLRQSPADNKLALRKLVASGQVPGILAYADDRPVGWCSVAPRECFPALDRSRTLKRLDDRPVWSIVCFFVARPFRRQRVLTRLIQAAVEYVRSQGGKVVEAYPLKPAPRAATANFMGLTPTFLAAGFEEVAQTSKVRSIVRCYL